MEASNSNSIPPEIAVLSRRSFLMCCAATAISAEILAEEKQATVGVRFCFKAPHPAHNPAFNYGENSEGELLVWLNGTDDAFKGYRLNKSAYRFWKCFDGNTPIADVVEKVSKTLNVSDKKLLAFAKSLEDNKLLVSEGEVVLGEGMERPPEGSCFYANVRVLDKQK